MSMLILQKVRISRGVDSNMEYLLLSADEDSFFNFVTDPSKEKRGLKLNSFLKKKWKKRLKNLMNHL